jgi:hypothetical protein
MTPPLGVFSCASLTAWDKSSAMIALLKHPAMRPPLSGSVITRIFFISEIFSTSAA